MHTCATIKNENEEDSRVIPPSRAERPKRQALRLQSRLRLQDPEAVAAMTATTF